MVRRCDAPLGTCRDRHCGGHHLHTLCKYGDNCRGRGTWCTYGHDKSRLPCPVMWNQRPCPGACGYSHVCYELTVGDSCFAHRTLQDDEEERCFFEHPEALCAAARCGNVLDGVACPEDGQCPYDRSVHGVLCALEHECPQMVDCPFEHDGVCVGNGCINEIPEKDRYCTECLERYRVMPEFPWCRECCGPKERGYNLCSRCFRDDGDNWDREETAVDKWRLEDFKKRNNVVTEDDGSDGSDSDSDSEDNLFALLAH